MNILNRGFAGAGVSGGLTDRYLIRAKNRKKPTVWAAASVKIVRKYSTAD